MTDSIERKQKLVVTKPSTAYVGAAAYLNVAGIGEVIVISADEDAVEKTFDKLIDRQRKVDKELIQDVAVFARSALDKTQ